MAVVAVLVGAAAFALSRGKDAPGSQLRALQADPLGRYTPPRSRLSRTDTGNDRAGGLLGKPQEATFTRLFAIPDAAPEEQLRLAVEAARDADWVVDKPLAGLGASGRKQLPTGAATMSIALQADQASLPAGVSAPALSISLRHLRR